MERYQGDNQRKNQKMSTTIHVPQMGFKILLTQHKLQDKLHTLPENPS